MGRRTDTIIDILVVSIAVWLLTAVLVVNLGQFLLKTGLAKARLITKSVINGLSLSLSLLVLVNYYYYSFTTTEVFA
jgi:hypothetical protein